MSNKLSKLAKSVIYISEHVADLDNYEEDLQPKLQEILDFIIDTEAHMTDYKPMDKDVLA